MAMAATASVQSILSLPTYNTHTGQGSKAYLLPSPSVTFSRHQQQRNGIRCMADEKLPEQPSGTTTPPPAAPKIVAPKAVAPPSPPPPTPKVVKKVSTKFSDVLGFSGPAPERINGRLAMVGFVAAIGAELAKGDDVVAQIANGGLPWFIGTSVVLSLASLVPLFKGVTVESKSKGFMTSDVEMLNGRFAMLGLIALVFTEFVTGGPLV